MRRSRRLVTMAALCAVVVAALAPAPAARAQGPLGSLCSQFQHIARAYPDVTTAVVMLDLQTGEQCEQNGDRTYRTASLYKTMVAAELYRQAGAGQVSLLEPLTIEPRHAQDDPEDLRITEPFTVSVYEAAERMLTFSENSTATALVERLVGDVAFTMPEWLGLEDTTFVGETYQSTPNDQAHLYADLYYGRVVDAAASNAIMDMLSRQEIADLIPAALPAGTRIAHKTGTLQLWLHDAGIIYAPAGDFVLVVMTESPNFDFAAARGAIHAVASAAYAAYHSPHPPILSPTDVMATTGLTRALPAHLVVGVAGAADGMPPGALAANAAGGAASDAAPPPGGPGIEVTRGPSDGGVLAQVRALFADAASAAGVSWTDPLGLAAMAAGAMLVLGLPAMVLRRSAPAGVLVSYGTNARAESLPQQDASAAPSQPGAGERLRADRSERGLDMRFGSRRDDESRAEAMVPASRSVAEVAQQPVLPSVRLQRVAEHFRSQGELLATMRDQFEEEMEPLHDLIVKQSHAMQALLENLEERLRPLNEYADGEETNLVALEDRIQAGGQDHVARSFSTYLEEQRRRIDETRDQIDRQRLPFLEYGDAQREAVEIALARFDSDIEALEANLVEQRRVMVRMLDAMRSETFTAVKDYLDGRQALIADLAETGSTDPQEIGRAVQPLRRGLEEIASKSDYVRGLLQQTESADRALSDSVPSPRALRQEPAPVDDDLADADEEEFSA